ncbi:MAG: CopD family protein [Chlamydiales bacterium]
MDILKFFHVVAAFFWIASLLLLTRIISWQGDKRSEVQRAFAPIYQRIYFFIELPCMVFTVLFGLVLLFLKNVNWLAPWLHMKLTFVALLIVCDLLLLAQVVRLQKTGIKGSAIGQKVLHWIVVFALLCVLTAIYILKPRLGG